MLEFTTNPRGLEGVLADVPREPLCRIDGEIVTIPREFPAMVGLAYVSVQQRYDAGTAIIWALQISLGSDVVDKLLNTGLTDDQLSTLTAIVVARIQGEPAPIPQGDATGPKARAPRQKRAAALKK